VIHTTVRRAAVGIATAALATSAVLTAVPAAAAPADSAGPASAEPTPASDPVLAALRQLEGTQSASEIDGIIDSGHMVATYTTGTSSTVVAAVDLGPARRALSFVGPGCSTDSLCMVNTSNAPSAYSGTGSLSGTWKRIKSAAAYGRSARFTWTGGALTVGAGQINSFGSPVTMTKVSR
jgi:hypothetical protein